MINPTKIIASIILLAAGLAFQSCTTDDDGGDSIQFFCDVVTFRANLDDGTVMFQFQQIDDSPVITLYARGQLDYKSVKPGTRLLMNYALLPGVKYPSSGNIRLRSLQRVFTDTVTTVETAPTVQQLAPMNLSTITRSGHYLNISAIMPLLSDRTVSVTTDQASLLTDTPDLYITTASPSEALVATYNSLQWASLSIEPVWSLEHVKGVKVHINNSGNPAQTEFTFPKQQ